MQEKLENQFYGLQKKKLFRNPKNLSLPTLFLHSCLALPFFTENLERIELFCVISYAQCMLCINALPIRISTVESHNYHFLVFGRNDPVK
jgi:hypothetical protein